VVTAALRAALAAALDGQVSFDAPLGPLTTYGVGGCAAALVEVERAGQLEALRSALAGHDVPVFVVGRGSNLLVSDGGFDGVAVRLGAGFNWVTLPEGGGSGPHRIEAGAATPLPVLARQAADAGWSGLSWAVGVPGSVGGAVRMNAGGHGSDMAACVVRYSWIDLLSEAEGTDGLERLRYGYRSSSLVASEVVVSAGLAVTAGEAAEEQANVSSIVKWRREHQPGGANAGSVFANPDGDSAGRLIEESGLKGFRLGTAHVSEKHANFIQADKGGRADDVRDLMEHVRAAVHERAGVALRTEVRLLGFPASETVDVTVAEEDR
jgi:UDP-N-acetylmuramate dehydrogenase